MKALSEIVEQFIQGCARDQNERQRQMKVKELEKITK